MTTSCNLMTCLTSGRYHVTCAVETLSKHWENRIRSCISPRPLDSNLRAGGPSVTVQRLEIEVWVIFCKRWNFAYWSICELGTTYFLLARDPYIIWDLCRRAWEGVIGYASSEMLGIRTAYNVHAYHKHTTHIIYASRTYFEQLKARCQP